jgi:hypothetical protein
VVFGIEKIFSVIETADCATENIFSKAEKMLVASDTIFFSTKSIFSVAENTVREAPAALLATATDEAEYTTCKRRAL